MSPYTAFWIMIFMVYFIVSGRAETLYKSLSGIELSPPTKNNTSGATSTTGSTGQTDTTPKPKTGPNAGNPGGIQP